jgi:hypothetical protein
LLRAGMTPCLIIRSHVNLVSPESDTFCRHDGAH